MLRSPKAGASQIYRCAGAEGGQRRFALPRGGSRTSTGWDASSAGTADHTLLCPVPQDRVELAPEEAEDEQTQDEKLRNPPPEGGFPAGGEARPARAARHDDPPWVKDHGSSWDRNLGADLDRLKRYY